MTEFAKWLDECPYLWLRLEETGDSVIYKFFPKEESEDDEADSNNTPL